MRPNLSLEYLAATLAALGTGAILAACGGSHQDAKASAVPASSALPWQGDKACAAHGCGASPAASAAPGDSNGTSASAPATSAAAGSGATATPTAATTNAPATPSPSSSAQAATPKPAPKPAAKRPKPASGDASCGQGTCSADPKKM